MNNLKFFAFLTCFSLFSAESFYLLTDKPGVTYVDNTVFPYVNVTASRYGRRNQQYYTNIHFALAVPLDDNYTVEIVFYENINNQFRRSFIEFQYKYCNFIFQDPVFGPALRRQLDHDSCPTPKGVYHLYNMTAAADHLPRLPFSKGRVIFYMKIKNKTILKCFCDMELKKNKPLKQLLTGT